MSPRRLIALLASGLLVLNACSNGTTERPASHQQPTDDASVGGTGGTMDAGRGGSSGTGGANTGGFAFEAAATPAAPTGLVLEIADATSIDISWVDNTGGAATFEIRWATENAAPGPANATVTASDGGMWSYRVTGLVTNQTYFFWVRAVVQGVYSDDVTGTKMPVTVPARPGSFRAAPGIGGTATLSWSPVVGESGYNVYWAPYLGGDAGIPTRPAQANKELPTGTTTLEVGGLEPCVQYYFWVSAINEVAEGPTNMTNAKPEVVPADPTDLNVAVVGTIATVSWKDNATNESDYVVSWASGTSPQKPVTGTSAGPKDGSDGGMASYVITSLEPGLPYTVWVEAKNCIGSSTALTGAANTIDLPPAPTTFVATVTGAASDVLHLTWVNVAVAGDGGATTDAKGIRIYYSTTTTMPAKPNVDNLPVTATSADITGLTPVTNYNFWIVAFNDSGESNPALKGTGAVGATPAAPTGLTVDSTTSKFRMTVSWGAATGGGATATQSWKLDWTINGLPANAAPIVIPVATTTYALTDVAVNSTYVFSLKASNVVGDSTAITSAPASSFVIAGHGGNAIKDAWIEPNGQIHLEWWVGTAGDTVGAASYTAYYALTNQRPVAGFSTQAPAAGRTTYVWSAGGFLATTTRYLWGAGAGADGTLVWPVQLNPGPDFPAGAQLTLSGPADGTLTASWPAVGNASYRIRWSETTTKPTSNADASNSAFVAAPTTTYTMTGLLGGTNYHVWVETTGNAIQNGVASPFGLPGAVGLAAVGKSGGATYKLISTAGMTATHNTAFVSNCPGGVFTDMNAWDADTTSLWGYDNTNPPTPGACVPFTVNGGIIQEWTSGTPWVQLDLGAAHAIARVRVDWQGAAGAIRYQVQGSANGTAWTNIVDVCNTTDTCTTPLAYSSDVWIPFTAPGGPAFPQYRYVRLILPSNKAADYKTTNYGCKVRSIELYEP